MASLKVTVEGEASFDFDEAQFESNECGGWDDLRNWKNGRLPTRATAFLDPEHEAAFRLGTTALQIVRAIPSKRWYLAKIEKNGTGQSFVLLYELWPSPPKEWSPASPTYVVVSEAPRFSAASGSQKMAFAAGLSRKEKP